MATDGNGAARAAATASGMSPRQGAGSHDANDPTTWDVYASSGLVIGLDIGQMSDHSAYVLAGCWPQAGNAVGVIGIKRFPLGMPLMQVAEEAAGLARKSNARIVCDFSNNSGFAQLLAPLLGERPANRLLAAVITAMGTHAAQAVPMAITINGKTAGIPRITLSKRELVEQIGVELDADRCGSARSATGKHCGTSWAGCSGWPGSRAASATRRRRASMTIWSRRSA